MNVCHWITNLEIWPFRKIDKAAQEPEEPRDIEMQDLKERINATTETHTQNTHGLDKLLKKLPCYSQVKMTDKDYSNYDY